MSEQACVWIAPYIDQGVAQVGGKGGGDGGGGEGGGEGGGGEGGGNGGVGKGENGGGGGERGAKLSTIHTYHVLLLRRL